jgi:hypothetical protein
LHVAWNARPANCHSDRSEPTLLGAVSTATYNVKPGTSFQSLKPVETNNCTPSGSSSSP